MYADKDLNPLDLFLLNMVIEYFSSPETSEFGIWMSTAGIPFDLEKVSR